jgi:hypothetical protein
MSHGVNFQVNYAWSKSLDTGTGNGHGSGVDIYQNAYNPGANYGLSDFNAASTSPARSSTNCRSATGASLRARSARPDRGRMARFERVPVAQRGIRSHR